MKAVIMAGGFGTRLRPLTNNLPKPMVPMVNKPMMEHIIELLVRCKITDLISLLYFHPEMIENYFGDGSKFGVKMTYVGASDDLGTAGSVRNAREHLDKPFLVISGDLLTDFDLVKAIEFHRKKKAKATMVLTRVENPLPFGIVITNEDGRIDRFMEKPGWGEVFSDTINTGIYILEPEILDLIPANQEFDFSKDLFPLLLERKEPLYGYIADGYWKDVGSLDEYRHANLDILHGKVKVNIPGEEVGRPGVWLGKDSRVDFTCKLEGSVVIGANCRIGGNCRITDSIIGDNSAIEEGATVISSIIWDNVSLGQKAALQENVVASRSDIREGAYLAEGAVISDNCRIGKASTVKAGVKVWPHKIVEDGATLASSLIWGEKWSKNIFGPYGVTGLANIEISPEFAAKLGAAYGASLRKGSTVSTSRDAHKTSRMINRAIMTGILSTGVNIHDYGVTPMPVVRYLAKSGNEVGGVHTRRSPFDTDVIDLKFFDNKGLNLHPNQEKAIERLFFREDFRRARMEETGEMIFPVHGFEYYQNGFMSSIDAEAIQKANFKVLLDYAYGSSSRIFPAILGKLNCNVIALNANLDGTRITKTAEDFQNSLDQLSSIVRSLRADIGVMLDAGGEKIFLVDENGDILDGDAQLNLITLLAMKSYQRTGAGGKGQGASPNTKNFGVGAREKENAPNSKLSTQPSIAVPVTASMIIDQMADIYDFSVKRTKTTTRGMMETAMEQGVVFVGEHTGGFIFPQFQPAFDGMYAIVKILEMMAKKDIRLHQLLREVPPSFMIKEKAPCSWEMKGRIMRHMMEDSRDKTSELVDGIKVIFDKAWVITYPSQDQSYFHVVAEAATMDKAKDLAREYREKIAKWQK
ncbi:MAG: mannose-1-phosphate guanyltransferase [Deltaproteobacteria bacterium]|nr:mannose-1-phosphate guanyltransferase [Deltaproteobacteria bacterium]